MRWSFIRGSFSLLESFLLPSMDVISILGPSGVHRTYTQDEFDVRFNYNGPNDKNEGKGRKKKEDNWMKTILTANWSSHRILADYLPALQWATRYGLKTDLPRDLLGSLLLAALFLPQALTAGVLSVDNAFSGMYSLIIPQLIYPIFGSSRHSSLGSLSFVSLLVHSSISHNSTNASSLSLIAAIIHLFLGIFPLDSFLSLVPDPLISGLTAALSLRLLPFLFTHSFSFKIDCGTISIMDVAFSSLPSCLMSTTGWLLLLSIASMVILLLSHYVFLHRFSLSIPVTPPFQLGLTLASIALSYTLGLSEKGVKILGKTGRAISFDVPSLNPLIPSIFDGVAIALFGMALHLNIVRDVAIEKMHTINRKQELISFSSFELPLSFLGLPPIGSAHGKAQLNVETARFSLVSNVMAVLWIILFASFFGPILKYLPYCVIACIAVTSFPGLFDELSNIRRIIRFSRCDASIWIVSFVTGVLCPNNCTAFLISFTFTLLTIVIRVQKPKGDILVRLTSDVPTYFAEDDNYEGEPMETPAKIYRFNGPLLFANVDIFRKEVISHAYTIKGAYPIGIGTRTASIRSTVEQKESLDKSLHFTSILINNEGTPSDNSLLKVLIIDCSAIGDIDTHGIDTLSDIFFELQEQSIRVLFAGASVRVRSALQQSGFFSRVSRSSFFPTLLDAHMAARTAFLPIHTSVSLNGCRDVIALSTATSNQELYEQLPEAV